LLLVIAALFAFTITLGSLPAAGRYQRITPEAVWGPLTAALAATWAVAGHAGTGALVVLAVPADTIHLSAMAIWLGGLALLAMIVLRHSHPATRPVALRADRLRGEPATAEAAQAVSRFSPLTPDLRHRPGDHRRPPGLT
jgi:putative copper export protein